MYLIIPDIHNKVEKFNEIMVRYNHIKTKVSLGDWHDSFEYQYGPQIEETARVQADFVSDTNNICLWGNHDLGYAFPRCYELGCSGFRNWKIEPINKWMKTLWNKVQLALWFDYPGDKVWLLSHAGFHPQFIYPDLDFNKKYVDNLCDQAIRSVREENRITKLLEVGYRRGGNYGAIGGCTWLDWRDFVPIPDINQIVGHTVGHFVREHHTMDSENYCIDTQLENVAIIDDDGTVTIEKV